jgi:hypothetical protein
MKARGQATTELALGSLVFVVVLLFGIHFGEVPVMMLKVKEAANYSVTHATGERTHLFNKAAILSGNTYSPFSPAAITADVQARYVDFDGMSDHAGGSTFSAALTQASGFRARCVSDPLLRFNVSRAGQAVTKRLIGTGQGFYDDVFDFLDTRYKDRGGISCDISANVTAFRIPTSFADQGPGGFFKAPMLPRGTFKVCGAGRPTNGVCGGKLTVLTGDWAFDGPLTGGNSQLNGDVESFQDGPVVNNAYEELVHQLYDRNGQSQGRAGRKLLEIGAGLFPGPPEYLDESLFNMSFKGASATAPTPAIVRRLTVAGPLKYQTSGADLRSNYAGWTTASETVSKMPTCFLGMNGCR